MGRRDIDHVTSTRTRATHDNGRLYMDDGNSSVGACGLRYERRSSSAESAGVVQQGRLGSYTVEGYGD